MYENDWYCPTKGTKQFLLILINYYVDIININMIVNIDIQLIINIINLNLQ